MIVCSPPLQCCVPADGSARGVVTDKVESVVQEPTPALPGSLPTELAEEKPLPVPPKQVQAPVVDPIDEILEAREPVAPVSGEQPLPVVANPSSALPIQKNPEPVLLPTENEVPPAVNKGVDSAPIDDSLFQETPVQEPTVSEPAPQPLPSEPAAIEPADIPVEEVMEEPAAKGGPPVDALPPVPAALTAVPAAPTVTEEENLFDEAAEEDDAAASPVAAKPEPEPEPEPAPAPAEENLVPSEGLFDEVIAREPVAPETEKTPAQASSSDDLFNEAPVQNEAATDAVQEQEPAEDVMPADEVPAADDVLEDQPEKTEEIEEKDPFAGITTPLKATQEPTRLWLDNTGVHETVGKLVEVQTDRIRILKTNGAFSTVPLTRLCPQDQAYVAATGARLAAEQRSQQAQPMETAGL